MRGNTTTGQGIEIEIISYLKSDQGKKIIDLFSLKDDKDMKFIKLKI